MGQVWNGWRRRWAILIALAGALCAPSGAAQVVAQSAARPDTVQVKPANPALQVLRRITVPAVAGQELSAAMATLRQAGFKPSAVSDDGSSDGRRIATRTLPAAGSTFAADAGQGVEVYHRRETPAPKPPETPGPAARTQRVPDLADLTAAEAVQRLRAAGLVPRLSPTEPGRWHRVRSQEPRAGATVPAQSAVSVTLAARYTVPSLLGDDCTAARERAAGAGLPVLTCTEEDASPDAAAGRVLRQQPTAGTVLAAPQTLQAWVARPRSRVPDLVGQSESAALAAARQARLQPQVAGPSASAGRVVSAQAPAAGSVVTPQSPLRLTLSLTVPRLDGLRCEAAQARAREHGLALPRCDTRPARAGEAWHTVATQQPTAGTTLAQPAPMTAELALPATVPDVRGLGLAQALTRLREAGLQGQAPLRAGEAPEDHDVSMQRPAAGAEALPGATVTLTTVRYVKVPEVAGLGLDAAQAALKQAGLQARPDATEAARRVVRGVEPAAGTRVRAGSAVALASVRRVTVPALAGASCDEARAASERAGTVVARCELDSLLPWVLGTPRVARQQPAAGDEVDEGTAITAVAVPPPWSAPTLLGSVLAVLAAAAKAGVMLLAPVKPRLVPTWRVRPDLTPRVTVRAAAEGGEPTGEAPPRWRVERPPPRVWLRAREDESDQPGGRDDEPGR